MISQTEKTLYQLGNLNTLQQKLSYQSSSGLKLQQGSDDSVLYSRLISVDDKIRTYEGVKTQIERTTVQNNTADSSMTQIKNIIDVIKSELIKANTSTTNNNGLAAIAAKISGSKQNLYDLANTQVEGEYVFSGSDSSVKPFEKNVDGSVYYNGNNKLRKIAVEEGSYRERGINGFDAMMYASTNASKGENLTFKQGDRVLDQNGNEWVPDLSTDPLNPVMIKYNSDGEKTLDTLPLVNNPDGTYTFKVPNTDGTKFEANTSIFNLLDNIISGLTKVDSKGNPISDADMKTVISDGIGEVDKAYNSVNIAHAELGARNSVFENSLDKVSSKLTQYNILSQELGASDLTEVAIKTKALELTYTALYSTISKTSQLSLVNYMN